MDRKAPKHNDLAVSIWSSDVKFGWRVEEKQNYNAGVSWTYIFGSDCHKYLHPSATHICQNVVAKTSQLSDSVEVQTKAHDIASKFQLFVRVHKRIAHALPSTDEEIDKLDSDIVR